MVVSTESNINRLLIMSGQITESKRKEFEQTFRMVSNTMPMDCEKHGLITDAGKEGQYHFYTLWPDEEALNRFAESGEYLLMKGAFHALGKFEEAWIGNAADAQKLIGKQL